jgi:hypothetical protein
MSGGVAMFDFDKDGLQDLYFVNAPTVASAAVPSSQHFGEAAANTFIRIVEGAAAPIKRSVVGKAGQ